MLISMILNELQTLSRLTVVSCAAKQNRMRDTAVCYLHERSILIECSPKATHNKLPYVKTMLVIKTALSWCCTHQLLNTLFEIHLV